MKTWILVLSIIGAIPAHADDDTLRDLGTNAAPGEIPKWDGSQWRNAHDNITTVNAGAGLSGTMTNGAITLVVVYPPPPIGGIMGWAKNLSGVSTNLPVGWVECNGQTLSDTNSPLNGQVIPDLNAAATGTNRFLRGASTSGNTGGEESHQLTTAEMPAHAHGVPACWNSDPYGIRSSIGNTYERNGGNGGYTVQSYDAGSGQRHNTLPSYYTVVWIMRVK
jgi:hypothetical protein